jgi:alkylhydroperoxidase/carboxymuconolactone decarboxylase family protein YurZ
MKTMKSNADRTARATALRRRLLGDEATDAIAAGTDAFNAPFQKFATENVFGGVWLNGLLPERELALVNIGMLAGRQRFEEMGVYVGVAFRVGVSPAEIRELLMHISVYCGTPVGRQAFLVARKALLSAGADLSNLEDAADQNWP